MCSSVRIHEGVVDAAKKGMLVTVEVVHGRVKM